MYKRVCLTHSNSELLFHGWRTFCLPRGSTWVCPTGRGNGEQMLPISTLIIISSPLGCLHQYQGPCNIFCCELKGPTRCSWWHIALIVIISESLSWLWFNAPELWCTHRSQLCSPKVVTGKLKHHTDCFACLQYIFHMSIRGKAPLFFKKKLRRMLCLSHLIRANQMSQLF